MTMAYVGYNTHTDDETHPDKYTDVSPGNVIDMAYVSSFIDLRGRCRYVPQCRHTSTAPTIVDDDNVARPQCTCTIEYKRDNDGWCGCGADYAEDVDILEKHGYIHLSIVTDNAGHEINMYSMKRPNQSQLDALFDFYMSAPDIIKDAITKEINTFLTHFNLEPMF